MNHWNCRGTAVLPEKPAVNRGVTHVFFGVCTLYFGHSYLRTQQSMYNVGLYRRAEHALRSCRHVFRWYFGYGCGSTQGLLVGAVLFLLGCLPTIVVHSLTWVIFCRSAGQRGYVPQALYHRSCVLRRRAPTHAALPFWPHSDPFSSFRPSTLYSVNPASMVGFGGGGKRVLHVRLYPGTFY